MTPLSVPLETSAKARAAVSIAMLAALHGAALWFMLWSERDLVPSAAFALAWGVLNAFWLMVLRRPSPAAAASLVMIVILTLLSRFKHHTLLMTVTFTDVMIIDTDTFSFLMNVFPALGWQVAIAAALTVPALALVWLFDRLRVRRRVALGAFALCFALLAGLSFAVPLDREDEFLDHNYLSKFARSGAIAAVDLATRGVLESDAAVAERLSPAAATECQVPGKAPHIVLILDEASYDASVIPGAKVAADYQRHFRSFDGKARRLIVEGAGGPTWYTEYNVLSGLSVRSYGRFAGAVTRLATGRVQRGLPQALRHCGYRTLSVYPSMGGFLGARSYQASAGIDGFFDAKDLGTLARQPDAFHYAFAERLIAAQRGKSPLFVLVYLTANHWPWGYRFRPDLTPGWAETGNVLDIDEYLRRQSMSVRDYGQFVARLARDFPDDGFLLVRFGDHQPHFTKWLLEPALTEAELGQRIGDFDLRYFTTYYALDTLNFRPVDLSSALDTIEAPHLPLVVLEAAGVPLDPSFAEQKTLLQRCRGLFYRCAGGAEARRFNRMLIDAGLIKGL